MSKPKINWRERYYKLQDEIKDAYGEDPRNTIVEYLLIKSIKLCLPDSRQENIRETPNKVNI